jgi:hypothetical protein
MRLIQRFKLVDSERGRLRYPSPPNAVGISVRHSCRQVKCALQGNAPLNCRCSPLPATSRNSVLASADSIGALQFADVRNCGVQLAIGDAYLRHGPKSPMMRLHAQSNRASYGRIPVVRRFVHAMPTIASAPNAPTTRTGFFFADERRPFGVMRPLSRRDPCFLRFRFPIGSSSDMNPSRAQAQAIRAHASASPCTQSHLSFLRCHRLEIGPPFRPGSGRAHCRQTPAQRWPH